MSAHRSVTRSALSLARRLAGISMLATVACTDAPAPVAPPPRTAALPEPAHASSIVKYDEFSNVQVGKEAFGIAIKFDYTGSIIPALTVGRTNDVLQTQIISVAAKKQAAGYWTAYAGGLEPGKLYYFRLDNMTSSYSGSAKTLRRDIVFDLDSIYVIDDADWGPGCGEWDVKATLASWSNTPKYNPTYQLLSVDMCSGDTYRYTAPGSGVKTFTDMQEDGKLQFIITEWDDCFPSPGSCTQQGYTLLYPFLTKQSGTTKFDITTVAGMPAEARFWGKIITKYVTW